MTLEQLAFRRNGYLHDIQAHHKRGTRDMRKDASDSQKCLACIEKIIGKRIAEAKAGKANG